MAGWSRSTGFALAMVVTASTLAGAVPSPPRLSARRVDAAGVHLRWTVRAPGAGQLELQRSPDATAWAAATTVPALRRRGMVDDLPPTGGRWFYRARLANGAGTSDWSVPARAQVPGPVDPPTDGGGDPPLATGQRECPADYAATVLQLVNEARRAAGVGALVAEPRLGKAARIRVITMAATRVFSHDGWTDVIASTGYPPSYWGENIAAGSPTPAAVMGAWMNSAGHRANIVSPYYRDLGVGCVLDPQGAPWWAQEFGG